MRVRVTLLVVLSASALSCGASNEVGRGPETVGPDHPPEITASETVTVSVVGTNDLHGHIRALPLLAGYMRNLRNTRSAEGGGFYLIDAGDMFQGTLESNLVEGASVIAGMNSLRYDATTVGNHEFDFGPAGPATTPTGDGDDPRGALIGRAGEARFPLLTANIHDAASGERVDWHPNMPARAFVDGEGPDVEDFQVGVIGVTTAETLRTTISGNVRDLQMAPIAAVIERYADELRSHGARLVIVTAHAGGKCEDCTDPSDDSSCDQSQEIFEVARALPPGHVDLIVAGHTHRGVAHEINGIPIIESYSYGKAFGRVDFTVDRALGTVQGHVIHPPQFLCPDGGDAFDTCEVGRYEGAPVERVPAVAEVIAPFLARAAEVEGRDLGVTVEGEFGHVIDEESAIGNLLADLIRESIPNADIGLMNGGGIRDGIDEGPLTYGELHSVFPFDNRFATARITGAELRAIVTRTLQGGRSIYSFSGVRVTASCVGDEPRIVMRRDNGRPIRDRDRLLVAASDFLVTGGDAVLAAAFAEDRATIDEGEPIREQLAERLSEVGRIAAARYFDSARRRLDFGEERPFTCP